MNEATQSSDKPARQSVAAAEVILRSYEELFARADVAGILAGFADDVRVRFADIPEFRGKAALERFLRARFARQSGYRLSKTLIATDADLIVGGWTGEWTDANTGKRMRGRGIECIRLRGRLCCEWDAVFNVWEDGGQPAAQIV